MTENLEQHKAFHDGLENLRAYCQKVQASSMTYDGAKIIEILDSFADAFILHLHDEIGSLAPGKMQAIFADEKDFKKMQAEMVRWARSNVNATAMLPWVGFFREESVNNIDVISSRGQDRFVLATRGYPFHCAFPSS
jgi:hypothetical protein